MWLMSSPFVFFFMHALQPHVVSLPFGDELTFVTEAMYKSTLESRQQKNFTPARSACSRGSIWLPKDG
jgi:hypothetical protein